MLILKCLLNSTFEQFTYSKASCMLISTTHLQKISKKFSFSKNNFKFQTNFQLGKNEKTTKSLREPQQTVIEDIKDVKNHPRKRAGRLPNPEIPEKTKNDCPRYKKKMSSLQYRGEILYGIHPVYLALQQKKRKIFQLFLRTSNEESLANSNLVRKGEIEDMAREQGILVSSVSSKDMKYLAPGMVHQGVCLDVSSLPLPEWQEAEIENQGTSNKFPIWLVLNELLDPMNVGAIIRSAYYFGIREVFIVKDDSCKLSPTVSKASSGALEVMNMFQIENLEKFIQIKKMEGWNIISTVAYCQENSSYPLPTVDVMEIEVNKPTILVLGNEGKGISDEIQNLSDTFVSIPPVESLHQGIDSLNVSVAAGVILYSLSTKKKNL